METNIVRVKYEDEFMPKTFSGKAYSYYSKIKLKEGDLVMAPTVTGSKIAIVSEVNISEKRIQTIKSKLKTIVVKVKKESYLKSSKLLMDIA